MAVQSLVKFVQGATVGTPGVALLGSAGTSVQVSNGASNAGVVLWTFAVVSVPYNSAVPVGVAQVGSTTTWTFTPDVTGCFIISLTVSDSFGNTSTDTRAFGILTASGHLVPSFTGDNNSLNFGSQLTGWDLYMEQWLAALEGLLDGTSPVAPIVKTSSFTASPGGIYLCTGPLTATIPSMSAGQRVKIIDYAATSGTSPPTYPDAITVAPPTGWKLQDPNSLQYGATSASVSMHVSGANVEWASDGTSKLYINA